MLLKAVPTTATTLGLVGNISIAKAAFGCKTSDQIRTESPAEKDAFLPHLVRVCGFIKARACAIWRPHIEMESEGVFGCNKELFEYEVAPCFDRRQLVDIERRLI